MPVTFANQIQPFIFATRFLARLHKWAFNEQERSVRLGVRTPDFHSGNTGSIPVQTTIWITSNSKTAEGQPLAVFSFYTIPTFQSLYQVTRYQIGDLTFLYFRSPMVRMQLDQAVFRPKNDSIAVKKGAGFGDLAALAMNLNQTFTILFWLQKSRMDKKGLAPIWVRITIDGRRAECSTSRRISPEFWDSNMNQAKPDYYEANVINEYLLVTRLEITRHYNILLSTKNFVTVEDVKNSYKGIRERVVMFKEVFDQFRQVQYERLQNSDITQGRFYKWDQLFNDYSEFVKLNHKRSDWAIKELKPNFANEFYHFISNRKKLAQNSAMKKICDLKQVMEYAVMHEYITSNPFTFFKLRFAPPKRLRLTMEEVDKLANKEISIARLREVRDCYLFVCYTGYSYKQLYELTPENVQLGIDGRKWIIKTRSKSKDSKENVPLLPVALEILEKYKNDPYCLVNNKLLPVDTNQKYNVYLKELATICGIDKNLTTHTARHTFATTIMLDNNVPFETVSKMLGHRNLKATQVYAEITDTRISDDTINLHEKIALRKKKNIESEDRQQIGLNA